MFPSADVGSDWFELSFDNSHVDIGACLCPLVGCNRAFAMRESAEISPDFVSLLGMLFETVSSYFICEAVTD